MTALDITGSLTNAHFVVRKYADDLRGAIDHLPLTKIANAIELIVSVLEQGQTVFIAGNGGSATTAQHMAADICSAWNDLGRNGSVNCLNDNVARWSALVNDYGPDEAFAGQLRLLARPGDLLITISVSAESSNLLAALYTARVSGLRTLSLAGRNGRVADLADLSVEVGDGDYGLSEDLHLLFSHCLVRYLRGGRHRYHEQAKHFGEDESITCAVSSQ